MEDKDGPLIEAIRTGQNINKNTYGYRRMTLWLNNFIGIHVNNKRVRRVMKKAELQAEIRKKKKFKVMSGNNTSLYLISPGITGPYFCVGLLRMSS